MYKISKEQIQKVLDVLAQGSYSQLRWVDVYGLMQELQNLESDAPEEAPKDPPVDPADRADSKLAN